MFLFSLECCFASELLCCCSITSNNHQGVNGDGRGFLGSLLVSVGGSMPLSTCWGDESGARKQLLRPNPNTGGTRRCGLRVLEVSFLQMCPLSYSIGLPVLQQPCALSSEYVTPETWLESSPWQKIWLGDALAGRAKGWIAKVLVSERYKSGPCVCRQTCAGEARDASEVCIGLQDLFGVVSYPGAEMSRYPVFLGCH